MGIPNYSVDYETQYNWIQVGTITAENAALGVDGRDNASVKAIADAKKVVYIPDIGTAAFVVRLRTDGSENNAFVLHMYAEKGDDYYTRVVDLACIQGTQDWSSGHFVDSITPSNEEWLPGLKVESTTNEIGRFHVNSAGFSKFLFISPDCLDDDITTVYIDIARADQMVRSDVVDAIVNMAGGIDLSDLNSTLSDMQTTLEASLDSIETDIEANTGHLDSAVNELQSVKADTAATANHLDSAVDAIDEVKAVQDSALNELNSIKADVTANTNHLDSAVNELQSIKADTATTASNLDSVVDAIDEVAGIEDSALNELNSIKADVTANTNHLDSAVNELQSIKADTAATVNHLDSAVDAIDEVAGIEDSALNELNSIKADVSPLNNHLDSAVDVLDTIAGSGAVGFNSSAGETEKLTLTSGTGTGASQACRECWVKPDPANTASVNMNLTNTADANDCPLDNRWMKVPVSNTNVLNFFSTDADAVVYIVWRN